jgi:hypothetical protein
MVYRRRTYGKLVEVYRTEAFCESTVAEGKREPLHAGFPVSPA